MVVNEIQAETGVAGSTLSHHLEKLKNDELVTAEREKAFIRYRANTGGARGAARVPVRRVLHAEQSRRAEENRRPLQMKGHANEHRKRQGQSFERSTARRRFAPRPATGEFVLRRRGSRSTACCDPITSNLYDAGQEGEVPDLALQGVARLRQSRRRWRS